MVFTGSACFGQVDMIDGWFTLGGRIISNEICFYRHSERDCWIISSSGVCDDIRCLFRYLAFATEKGSEYLLFAEREVCDCFCLGDRYCLKGS